MTVAIQKILVPREHRKVYPAQVVSVQVQIVNITNNTVPYDPSEAPSVTVYNPSGTQIASSTMSKIDTGLYAYEVVLTDTSPVGIYTAQFVVVDNGDVAVRGNTAVFEVFSSITLPTYTYIAIQDQNSVVWYWYLDITPSIQPSSSVPSVKGFNPVEVTLTPTPHWLEIDNPSGTTRYIHPDLSGDAVVATSQPATGTGKVDSPTLKSTNGNNYIIALNVSDSIILTQV